MQELEAKKNSPQKNTLLTGNHVEIKHKTNEELQCDRLVDYIVGSYLPISTCENVKFRNLILAHNPTFKDSRESITSAIVKKAARLRRVCSEYIRGKYALS